MNLLTGDIGSTYTKLTAINTVQEKIIATAIAFTTILELPSFSQVTNIR